MSNGKRFSWDRLKSAPIIGIVRGMPLEDARMIGECYCKAGLSTLEITMNTPGVLDIIRIMRDEFPTLNIGAGTVCTLEDLEKAIQSGAQFIVTPILNEEVILRARSLSIPIFPGAFTPTEIYKAWSLGATAVKLFPASGLGPSFIKDILAPLDEIKVVPTGGVSIENVKAYFEAGASAVGMGSSLLDKGLIQDKDYNGLTTRFEALKSEIRDFIIS